MKAKIFTVADPHVGLGHLFRCDALAEALRLKGVNVELIVHCIAGDTWLREKPLSTAWKISLWTESSAVVEKEFSVCDIPVFDAYDVNESVWEYLAKSERAIVLFDDFGEKPELKGLLINGSPGAFTIQYSATPVRTLLLGPGFQVLRPPFWNPTPYTVKKTVNRIGILVGGTDHLNLSGSIAEIISNIYSDEVTIFIIGKVPVSIHNEQIQYTGVLSAIELKNLYDTLDLIVCGAGQSAAEAVSCAVPAIILCIAENQDQNYRGWISSRAVLPGGDFHVSTDLRKNHFYDVFQTALQYEIRNSCSSVAKEFKLADSTSHVCNEILAFFRKIE